MSKGAQQVEESFQKKNGERFLVAITARPIVRDGELECYVANWVDITERRRAEAMLWESQQRYRRIVESSPMGMHIYELKDDGRLVFAGANPAANRILGVDHSPLVGKTIEDAFPPLADTEVPARYRDVAARGTSWQTEQIEYAHKQIAGAFEVSATQIERGRMVATFQDITDRKRTESALRSTQYYLERAQEIGSIGTWELDLIENVLVWTDENYRVFGVPIGTPLTYEIFLSRVHPEDREFVHASWNAALEHEPYDIDHRLLVDGKTKWVREKATVNFDENGRAIRAIGFTQDISERRQAEAERRKLETQIQQTQKLESLGVLAGGIAHDFNNILTGLLGNADLAVSDLPSHSPVRPLLHDIQKAGRQAADLTGQMLAYSGKGRFVVEDIDINALVQDMSSLLESSTSKKVELGYELGAELPAVTADATQLRQIVLNLVTNASEAVGNDGGIVRLRTYSAEYDRTDLDRASPNGGLAEGRYVTIEVNDTGCGMDDETKANVFDPFFTTKFTGRGLGLAAVQGIVRGHEGAILVDSELGSGTTFKVLLPALDRAAEAVTPQAKNKNDWQGRGTILVVDDETMVRRTAVRMIERMGFSLLAAADGVEAIAIFREHQSEIVCVLLDLKMPNMDGKETFDALRRISGDVPVVLSSGYSEQDSTEHFSDQSLAGFIQKPYDARDLREKFRKVLDQ